MNGLKFVPPRRGQSADAGDGAARTGTHARDDLDTRNRVITTVTVYVGSLNTSVIRVGELFREAIRLNAAGVIIAHNHPFLGYLLPSPEDVSVTRHIIQAGQMLDIEVLDHVVIGRQRFVSLKERGLAFA